MALGQGDDNFRQLLPKVIGDLPPGSMSVLRIAAAGVRKGSWHSRRWHGPGNPDGVPQSVLCDAGTATGRAIECNCKDEHTHAI